MTPEQRAEVLVQMMDDFDGLSGVEADRLKAAFAAAIREAVAAERERCAGIVESIIPQDYGYAQLTRADVNRIETAQAIAAAIRK